MIGCGTKNSDSGNVAPISFKYTLEKEETNDEKATAETYYVLSGVTVSDKAKTLIEKNDYEGLAELFNTAVEGVYEAPAVKYTKETVRKLTIPETHEGKAVKKIAADAVVDLTFIEEIEVKSNVEEIGLGSYFSEDDHPSVCREKTRREERRKIVRIYFRNDFFRRVDVLRAELQRRFER